MNDIQFKELIEKYINLRLNNILNETCFEKYKGKYIIQENKYNKPSNTDIKIFNISTIDYDNNIVTLINSDNLQYPLENKKIFVNYNNEINVTVYENNILKFKNKDDLYLVAQGDIVTENVDKQENKIYIIVDVDNVRVETETISSTHNNTYYDVNIFIGSNDYSKTKEEFNFFFNEIIRIFNEQSFNINYNEKNLDVFTVDKPRYRSSVKTENDRVGYIILRFSHFYNNKIRI